VDLRNARKISVVLPTFNEEKNVGIIYDRIAAVVTSLGISEKEIIYVDDGSRDKTVENVRDLARKDTDVKLLRLSSRVGHQISCFAGMREANGDVVVTLDSDLQHPPELIKEMYERWQEGADIVSSVRKDTIKSSFFKKIFSKIFYATMNKMSRLEMKANTADFRLLGRNVIEELSLYEDRDLFLRGIITRLAYKKAFVEYTAQERMYGKSKYDFRQSLKFGFTGLFYFSEIPLKLSIYAAVLCLLFTIGYIAYELVNYLSQNGKGSPPGYITLVILINVYSGFILLILGIVGIYINKIYHQTKKKPIYYIAEKINL
jgi:glycosyltransferase involved in cell wall biosynthesis